MRKGIIWSIIGIAAMCCMGCHRPSKAEIYYAEKHRQDSIALVEQQRSMDYYLSQRDSLMPKADSLTALFKYERDPKYQDHGYYVLSNPWNNVRILVREDGGVPMLIYRNGNRTDVSDKQLTAKDRDLISRAAHLSVVMGDMYELEKRIKKTSLEIEKYQKRLQKP